MKSARILVVDDERPLREVLMRALAAQGHRPAGAASAEEALTLLAASPFDFVLIDHVMPGLTGLQALPKLRALTAAPVHLMSGDTGGDCAQDAALLGASGFFPKPLDLQALYAALASLPEAAR